MRKLEVNRIYKHFKGDYYIVLGTGISYWIYKISAGSDVTSKLKFIFPTKPVIISIVFIAIIVGIIMRYSLNKINKQNIIETIRNDNI